MERLTHPRVSSLVAEIVRHGQACLMIHDFPNVEGPQNHGDGDENSPLGKRNPNTHCTNVVEGMKIHCSEDQLKTGEYTLTSSTKSKGACPIRFLQGTLMIQEALRVENVGVFISLGVSLNCADHV